MVSFAFIFVAAILLMPIILLVMVFDFVMLRRNRLEQDHRGFEVLPLPPKKKRAVHE
jgi:hypothetical protein